MVYKLIVYGKKQLEIPLKLKGYLSGNKSIK